MNKTVKPIKYSSSSLDEDSSLAKETVGNVFAIGNLGDSVNSSEFNDQISV